VVAEQEVRGSDQPTRLRITNGCGREPIWIAHEAGAGVGPDPQNIKIAQLESYDFTVPAGLSGTRYWPKLRCDARGNACRLGESGGPQQNCGSAAGCAPPVDTKFEGSFGLNGEDWVDISLVDGFTLPFKFEMFTQNGKQCAAGDGDRHVETVVDCSKLSFESCPTSEDLGIAGKDVDLAVRDPHTNQTVGCYSPCSKLTLNQWDNAEARGRTPWDEDVKEYCCPTPPESPEACRKGPVGKTNFVRAVHRGCPGVYGYAYDDGMGLLKCPDDTKYRVTFYCPHEDASPLDDEAAPVAEERVEREEETEEDGKGDGAQLHRTPSSGSTEESESEAVEVSDGGLAATQFFSSPGTQLASKSAMPPSSTTARATSSSLAGMLAAAALVVVAAVLAATVRIGQPGALALVGTRHALVPYSQLPEGLAARSEMSPHAAEGATRV